MNVKLDVILYKLQVTSLLAEDIRLPIDYKQDFFGKKTFLTVSGQLHLEPLVCGGLGKAWCMTTAFRGEKSTGPHHLAEFWMAELEACFDSLEENMDTNERCIKYCIGKVLEKCSKELELIEIKYKVSLREKLEKYHKEPFIITTHKECVKAMLDAEEKGLVSFKVKPCYDDDLSKEHEKYITEVLYDRPVFVRYYPAKVKAFYMPKINRGDEVEYVDCFDLLFPGIGEVVGGSQRESDYHTLIKRMDECKIDPKKLEHYCEIRIGFDRLMLLFCGDISSNIRDMVPYPRSYKTCLY